MSFTSFLLSDALRTCTTLSPMEQELSSGCYSLGGPLEGIPEELPMIDLTRANFLVIFSQQISSQREQTYDKEKT